MRVPASLGDRVAAGEVLAVLDSVELGEARASYLWARARDEAARRRFERERSLREERISTEQDLLDAEAAAREAAADLALARESLCRLGLSDEEIEDFAWADPHGALVSVRAPFAGRVVERKATVGELVGPERTLFMIADLSQLALAAPCRPVVPASGELALKPWPRRRCLQTAPTVPQTGGAGSALRCGESEPARDDNGVNHAAQVAHQEEVN